MRARHRHLLSQRHEPIAMKYLPRCSRRGSIEAPFLGPCRHEGLGADAQMALRGAPLESVVQISDVAVMYVAGERGKPISAQAPGAFDKLEAKLATLKGRHFYGVVVDGEYRACVALRAEDDRNHLPHPTWIIPGGKYARRKIADWEKHRSEIGPTMMRLRDRKDLDVTRPCIEYYRSQRELLLMVPIL